VGTEHPEGSLDELDQNVNNLIALLRKIGSAEEPVSPTEFLCQDDEVLTRLDHEALMSEELARDIVAEVVFDAGAEEPAPAEVEDDPPLPAPVSLERRETCLLALCEAERAGQVPRDLLPKFWDIVSWLRDGARHERALRQRQPAIRSYFRPVSAEAPVVTHRRPPKE